MHHYNMCFDFFDTLVIVGFAVVFAVLARGKDK